MWDPNYRATDEHWAIYERGARYTVPACILELRARIEALEAAQQPDQITYEPKWHRLSEREPQVGDHCIYQSPPNLLCAFGTWHDTSTERISRKGFWNNERGLFVGDPERISWRIAMPHELFPDQPAPATEESSATAPSATDDRLRWCPTHGQQPRNAWGCPECVRELRAAAAPSAPAGVQRRYPSPVTIAECGGPCDSQGPEACDCGLLQELNPPLPAPAGGLVERVAKALYDAPHPVGSWRPNARAAIREVAQWLEQQQEVPIGSASASADYFAAMLRSEANR
jgi:hypothetical protein